MIGMQIPRSGYHIRQVTIAQAVGWLTGAWQLFKKAPFPFMAFLPLSLVAQLLLMAAIPNQAMASLLSYTVYLVVWAGGIAIISQLARTGTFKWGFILDPLQRRPIAILAVLLIAYLPTIISVSGAYLIFRQSELGEAWRSLAEMASNHGPLQEQIHFLFEVAGKEYSTILIAFLLMVTGWLIGVSIGTFGPFCVILTDMTPPKAASISVQILFSNVVPMLVLGLVVVALVPFMLVFTLGLATIVLYPLSMLVQYLAFVDLVAAEQPPT